MSNFSLLSPDWPTLHKLGEFAEQNLYIDPNTSLIKLRMFAEVLTKYLIAYEKLSEPTDDSQISRINMLVSNGTIPDPILPLFHSLRKSGNRATHEIFGTIESAQTHLQFAYRLAIWFRETYGQGKITPPEFTLPKKNLLEAEHLRKLNEDLQLKSKELEEDYKKLQSEIEGLRIVKASQESKTARRKLSAHVANRMHLTEAETRLLIDEQLSAAGWLADSQNIRFARGARPGKGMNKAIAEWPTESGPVDYALFAGKDLVGVVEAKKKGKDVVSDMGQAKRYAADIELTDEIRFIGGPWGKYKAPFLFTSNGRPYLKQLEHKSGIWFLDGRRATNHPRPLQAWYTPQGLLDLFKQDIDTAAQNLKKEPFDYLDLRDYQRKAIQRVEDAFEKGKSNVLLAMATGTGKTRTAIGLIYRLIKLGRFKRILFLVDRSALGEQAANAFKETRLEDLHTFDQIFDLQEIDKPKPEETTKVHIATVQGMVKRIMFNTSDEEIPTVDQYDCIVVDEAHRGYTLDRELGEVELLYRDENDYISKYRKVLEYFDSVKVGLTATPAPHTIEIFGKPIFTYSYREAVVDGWLVDHEPPHQIETKLKRQGITWKKGETVPVFDKATGEITNLENIPDEVKLEIDDFNKMVITENFNRTVAKELVQEISPDSDEKTLIFAATDDHADLVVKLLKEEFEKVLGEIDDDCIAKITGSIDKPLVAIRKFKNEKHPAIAVTVDLLTTGVDVPEICNLVFLRRVRSRILYEQMMGRATRLCDRIGKTHFNIYDAVGLYEALQTVSNMKAVVPRPNVSLQTLFDEFEALESEEDRSNHMEQIIAKLQRKARGLTNEQQEAFQTLSGGQSIHQFIDSIKGKKVNQFKESMKDKQNIIAFLDENRYQPQKQLISNHADELSSHSRGYGKGDKPEDYINEFKSFIIDNLNRIPALSIVCQRPRELTRQGLKELKMILDKQGFTEVKLRTAWREWTNEDIAADIISFVRRQALGDPLVSHEERIKQAMKKVYSMKTWTKLQRQWLERIEKQLISDTVVERDDFDKGAFKDHGGYDRINRIFEGSLNIVLDEIHSALYPERRKTA